MSGLGIIGSGKIGGALARLAVAAGIEVVLANSRGPDSLADVVSELGPLASAGTVERAAAAGDRVILSVPLCVIPTMPVEHLRGKIVLDTSNYYPARDGRIAELDADAMTTSELVDTWLDGARLVKAFNSILAHHIPMLARPSGADDRTALPVASDDEDAKEGAEVLVDALGFDLVDAGPLAESWRFEPDTAAYTTLYAPPNTPLERLLESPGRPVSSAELSAALARAERVRVADRAF